MKEVDASVRELEVTKSHLLSTFALTVPKLSTISIRIFRLHLLRSPTIALAVCRRNGEEGSTAGRRSTKIKRPKQERQPKSSNLGEVGGRTSGSERGFNTPHRYYHANYACFSMP